MASFKSLWEGAAARAACAGLLARAEETLAEAVTIQGISAPTFQEHERAEYVRRCFEEMSLSDVSLDDGPNVYGRVLGAVRGPGLLVTAHLDTVFEAGTDLTTRRDGERLYGPGIGDNSLGVAGLLALARAFRAAQPRRDIWFVANAGEEGMGNLHGMRTVIDRLGTAISHVIVLEGGAYGMVVHQGLGVVRRRLIVETAGGHAWSNFGAPSAIHELCRIGAAIAAIEVPKSPRTSFNLGLIEGGTSINTIAARATTLLDLRSEEPRSLEQLGARVDEIVQRAGREGVRVWSEQIGERPAGGIPATHPLVQAAVAALRWVGCSDPKLRPASTDANIPLARGIPAVVVGLAVGHDAHRLEEAIEPASLPAGLQQAYLLILAATSGATLQ